MNNSHTNTGVTASRPHFHVLDGLRGVAALAVVIFHFMEWVHIDDFSKNFIAHGFLAVDFFFCLSGFVMAYAYDKRLSAMGLKHFFKARLIRLHPLVVLGSVIGLLGLYFDPFSTGAVSHPASKMILIVVSSMVLIPLPVMNERFNNNFGLNAPAWSLFWEYVANVVYALVLVRLKKPVLFVLALVSGLGILYVAKSSGTLSGGWAGENFLDGGVRLAYSFTMGILIYRLNWKIKNKLGFVGLSALLSLAFIIPSSSYDWISQSMVVLVYFPLIVALGYGAVSSGPMEKVCRFAGDISYPLYMTHYAGIWIFSNYWLTNKPQGIELVAVISGGTLLMVGVAWLAMKFYDQPLRRYMSKKA